VIPSIKLAAYMARYKLEGYQRGLKKILLLIWSKDKGTKQEILKQFWKLYLDKKK
jgi:condensin complex subunit 1